MPEPRAMEIPVSVPGVSQAIRDLARMVRQVNSVSAAQKTLTSSTRTLSQAAQTLQMPAAAPAPAVRPIRGPIARLNRLRSQRAAATTDDERADADILIAQAQRRLLNLQRRGSASGGIMGRLQGAILSSRVNVGGGGIGVAPLVSRVMDVLESLPGPVGMVTKGLAVLAAVVTEATRHIGEFARASAESGGSIREVAILSRLGLPPGQVAAAASGLRERLVSDPNAAAAANRLGLPPTQPFVAGGQDNAKILIRTLDALRRVTDAEERLRLARMLGVESMMDLLRASDYVYRGIKLDAEAQEQVMNKAAQQAQADVSVGWGRVVENFKTIIDAVAVPAMKVLGPVLNGVASELSALALAANATLAPINAVLDVLNQFGLLPALLNPLGNLLSMIFGGAGGSGQDRALKENTDALNANTRALSPGTFGGGERLRGALPGSLGGELLRRGMEGNAIRMGAFSLG